MKCTDSVYFFFSRRTVGSALYQSTGSLHSDGHSSNSMSPAPSPSPTHALAQNTVKASKKIVSQAHYGPKSTLPTRPLSGSLSNLNLSTSRKWNSTNDFKDQGPLSNIRYLLFSTIQGVQQFPPQLGQAPALSFVVLLMMWSTNLGNFFWHIKHIGNFIKAWVLVGNIFRNIYVKLSFYPYLTLHQKGIT